MFEVNNYFAGDVVSIAYQGELPSTVGVMAVGSYTFNTSQHENMLIIDGDVEVKIAQQDEFEQFTSGGQFSIQANSHFEIKVLRPTAYLCTYG